MRLMIYASGGFGINVASELAKFEGENKGYADLSICFIDTSRSNLIGKKEIKPENVYILDNVDGSGKKRDQNYEVLSESAKDILHKYKPGDVNVVLHSASGGKVAYS